MIVNDLRVHHFFPTLYDVNVSVKKTPTQTINNSPEYSAVNISKSATSFWFSGERYPVSESDIFCENLKTRFLVKNKIIFDPDQVVAKYKLVSRGKDSTSTKASGLYDINGAVIHETEGSYSLHIFSRISGEILSSENYDLISDPNETSRLISALNSVTTDKGIILICNFEPKANRNHLLLSALSRFGVSLTLNSSTRFKEGMAYVLCAVPNNLSIPPIELFNSTYLETELIIKERTLCVPGLWEDAEKLSGYRYNHISRIVYFLSPFDYQQRISWYDMRSAFDENKYWRTVSLKDVVNYVNPYVQGVGKPTEITGKFQGGVPVYIQLETLPSAGLIRCSTDRRTLMYRCSDKSKATRDGLQIRLHNMLGQDSEPYCVMFNLY